MKVELADDTATLSITEVVEQLRNSGAIDLAENERIGECRLEFGCDLEIDIHIMDDMDKRIDGHLDRTETFTDEDLRAEFSNADYCVWAKGEDGDDILLCFGAC